MAICSAAGMPTATICRSTLQVKRRARSSSRMPPSAPISTHSVSTADTAWAMMVA